MQLLSDEIRMASDGKGGQQNVMVCRSHIIVYYGNRETIRYGKAARQSTYRYKPFFFSCNFSVKSLSLNPKRSFGERVMVMAEKRKKYFSGCLAVCPEKVYGGYVASKTPSNYIV